MILYPWTPEMLQKVQLLVSLIGGSALTFLAFIFFLEGIFFQKWVPKKEVWEIAQVLVVIAILIALLGIYVTILGIVVMAILGLLSLVC